VTFELTKGGSNEFLSKTVENKWRYNPIWESQNDATLEFR
jgi:hypothetical protein